MSDLNPASQFVKKADKASDSANGSSVTGDTSDSKGYDIINSYNFVLRVEGFQNLPLKAVRGINKQNEYEYIQEGGLNDYVHMVRKPISQPFTFQVERYVAQGWLQDAIDPLANGTELMLPLVLYMYRSNAHDDTAPSRYYIFTNCRVMGVQVGDLDAEKSGLHTITNTIAYSQMTIITLPFLGIDDDSMYQFNVGNAENKINTSHVRTLRDMGYTKMTKLNADKDRGPNETDAQFAKRNAAVDYRGYRNKEDMKTLSVKYKYVESKPVKGDEGTDTEESRNQNTKQVVVQTNNRKGAKRKFIFNDTEGKSGVKPNVIQPNASNPMDNGSIKSANTQNVEKAASKKAMEDLARHRKYDFKSGGPAITGFGQRVSVSGNVAASLPANLAKPEKIQPSKSTMEEIAAENKYKFANGKKDNKTSTKNVKTANNRVGEPGKPIKYQYKDLKPQTDKNGNETEGNEQVVNNKNTDRVAVQKKNRPGIGKVKYEFKKGDKANLEHLSAKANDVQLDKEGMEGKAKKYNFQRKSNGSAVHDELEINKTTMEAMAEMHNKQPHYSSQKNEKAEVRNSYKYGGGPTENVQIPINHVDKKTMESIARKYPPTRSARDVIDFLRGKK